MRSTTGIGLSALFVVVLGAWALVGHEARAREAAERGQATSQAELERVSEERDRLARTLASERHRAPRVIEESVATEQPRQPPSTQAQEPAPVDAPPPEAWRERLAAYPAFVVEGLDGGLEEVDWVSVGENMSALPALVKSVTEHALAGGDMSALPPETIGTIQTRSAPILTVAMTLQQNGTPGTGVNGAVTHPSVMSNAIAASLDVMGLPLDDSQTERVLELTVRFSRRDDERRANLTDEQTALAQIVGESELRHDYFTAVFEVLGTEQNEALRPVTRGRLRLDLFSESLLWIGRAGPRAVTDRDDLAETVSTWIIARAALAPEVHERTRELIREWANDVPQNQLDRETTLFVRQGNLHVDEVVASARETVRLFDLLIAELDLPSDAVARIHALPGSLVWYRRADGDE